MWLLVLLIIGILVFSHLYLTYSESGKLVDRIPGPKGLPIIGNFFILFNKTATESFTIFRNLKKEFNGVYKLKSFHILTIYISEPEDIEILLTNTKEIRKSILYELFKPWLGSGLLTATGSKWHKRRKLLTPAFHFSILKNAFKIFNEGGKDFVKDIAKCIGEEVDVHEHVTKFTLHSICKSAMGIDLNEGTIETDNYRRAVYDIGQCIVRRQANLLFKTNFLIDLLPLMRFNKKVTEILQNFTNKVIDERRKISSDENQNNDNENVEEDGMDSEKKRLAMLDLLLKMEKEGNVDQNGIQEEVDTFTFAGHDTTTSGIKFLLLNLANHKDIQERLVEELKEVITSQDEEITMNLINKMPYLDRCVKESLRLYPPIHLIGRNIYQNFPLRNYVIPKNAAIAVSIFDLHRNPKYYPDPLKYDPERFTPENSANRHPFSYIPFSAGLRNCIGQKYATFEIKSIAVTLLRNYIILPVTKPEDLIFSLDITLNTANPIKVIFKERTDKF